MKKLILGIITSIIISLASFTSAEAIQNPLDVTNNKYGIHILDTKDIPDAKNLANSTGGDWGYITLVIREDERDTKRWQKVFDELRSSHLIPIVRIATTQSTGGWRKIQNEESANWAYFLNSLNWVVKNRYIVIGNEPNHPEEWEGEVNPNEYVNVLCTYSKTLKASSEDFFILPAGFDASAPDKDGLWDEERYIKEMYKVDPNFINCIDGLTSHSYPNPAFSGPEHGTGKGSVRTYIWEIELLSSLGNKKRLPVFITETGWVHSGSGEKTLYKPDDLSSKYISVFTSVWNDSQVAAITPFVLSYDERPFDKFSWKSKGGSFYPFYESVRSLPKQKGNPIQINKGEILLFIVPKIAKENSSISGLVYIKNEGQSIWDNSDTEITGSFDDATTFSQPITSRVEPFKSSLVSVRLNVPEKEGSVRGKLTISRHGKTFSSEYRFEIYTFKSEEDIVSSFIHYKDTLVGWITQRIKYIFK